MNNVSEKIISMLNKIEEDIDTVGLNDNDAWNNIRFQLERVIQDIPDENTELVNILSLCIEGVRALSDKSVADSLSLVEKILPELKGQRLRFWNAACSSGEEPFSLAILLIENIRQIKSMDVRILATDISTKMLNKARRAVYEEEPLRDVPRPLLLKHFIQVRNRQPLAYQVKDNVSSMVQLTWLNLMDSWPMKGLFNVIFCRNVMIYFDRPTQQKLINRFWEFIEPGGHLFVGNSESLSAISHKFKYMRPATYRKEMSCWLLGDWMITN